MNIFLCMGWIQCLGPRQDYHSTGGAWRLINFILMRTILSFFVRRKRLRLGRWWMCCSVMRRPPNRLLIGRIALCILEFLVHGNSERNLLDVLVLVAERTLASIRCYRLILVPWRRRCLKGWEKLWKVELMVRLNNFFLLPTKRFSSKWWVWCYQIMRCHVLNLRLVYVRIWSLPLRSFGGEEVKTNTVCIGFLGRKWSVGKGCEGLVLGTCCPLTLLIWQNLGGNYFRIQTRF